MMDFRHVAFKYALISALATAVNIATQALVVTLYSSAFAIQLSVLVGTATGFPIKYVLEKKHVFEFKADNLAHDSRLFILYGIMGVFTTAIFWGIEWVFHVIFHNDAMRYLGGGIGLILGSLVKYFIDKKYVFKIA